MVDRVRIEYEGIVQGVGFRPFLHQLAAELGLAGWVLNTSAGVLLELEGEPAALEDYLARAALEAPPLSRILATHVRWLPAAGFSDFSIRPSQQAEGELTLLCPDVATCADCRRELFDPADRRYRYPFINCTNCGPRYTIVKSLPYDRPATTMAGFPLCTDCDAEYHDLRDRRYHAQPVACASCGPRLWLADYTGREQSGDAIQQAVQILRTGGILAVKGLGGFHLACRADRDEPILTLRRRKRRSFFKPLAVMAPDLDGARQICRMDRSAEEWLSSPISPVVLLPLAEGALPKRISRYAAPRLDRLGLMLPYTPLHHLLLSEMGVPLVMTSGNLSDEPIIADNDEAIARLGPLADGLLLHNRPIHARCDDSVLAVDDDGSHCVLRHSRGFAPYPLAMPREAPAVLALGGDIKTTFAASRGHFVFFSPHLGDGEQLATYSLFGETWEHYRALFGLDPQAVACDAHPGYATTLWAEQLAADMHVPLLRAYHHHAHLAALIAEYSLDGPQLALVADGTGYGEDGTIWGGELLFGDANRYERVAHLRPLPLPGGDSAVREPWRIALALLYTAAPEFLPRYLRALFDGSLRQPLWAQLPGRLREEESPTFAPPQLMEAQLVTRMLATGTSLVACSSLGRLLDGLAALLGICLQTSYEGQAPMELEALLSAAPDPGPDGLPDSGSGPLIDWAPLVRAIASTPGDVTGWAWRIHHWVAHSFMERVIDSAGARGTRRLLASGGCLQNSALRRLLHLHCRRAGLGLTTPRDIPPGDGGLALGMLRIAQARLAGNSDSR